MDSIDTITQLISNVGFPIATSVALFYLMVKTIGDLKTTLNNNTIVLEKLLTKLDIDEHTNGEA